MWNCPNPLTNGNELLMDSKTLLAFPTFASQLMDVCSKSNDLTTSNSWYCRNGYPAINAQVVVDHKTKIPVFDLRPGSAKDKSVFNYSSFGQNWDSLLPAIAGTGIGGWKAWFRPFSIPILVFRSIYGTWESSEANLRCPELPQLKSQSFPQ